MERKCENCDFYEGVFDDGHLGECHRFPPVWAPEAETEDHEACCYTRVLSYMWCGEFKPKEKGGDLC